jgi:hypothetical protein
VGGLVCSLAAGDARGRIDTGVEVLEPNRLVSRPLCRTKLESRHRSDKRGARAARLVLSQVYRLWQQLLVRTGVVHHFHDPVISAVTLPLLPKATHLP